MPDDVFASAKSYLNDRAACVQRDNQTQARLGRRPGAGQRSQWIELSTNAQSTKTAAKKTHAGTRAGGSMRKEPHL